MKSRECVVLPHTSVGTSQRGPSRRHGLDPVMGVIHALDDDVPDRAVDAHVPASAAGLDGNHRHQQAAGFRHQYSPRLEQEPDAASAPGRQLLHPRRNLGAELGNRKRRPAFFVRDAESTAQIEVLEVR